MISSFALLLGLIVANVLRPGADLHADPRTLDGGAVAQFTRAAGEHSVTRTLLHLIPRTFTDAFGAEGDLLQVLVVALLFGFALNTTRARSEPVRRVIEAASHVFFRMI